MNPYNQFCQKRRWDNKLLPSVFLFYQSIKNNTSKKNLLDFLIIIIYNTSRRKFYKFSLSLCDKCKSKSKKYKKSTYA